jgi:hypothetical protein
MKKIKKQFINNVTPIDADDLNEIVDAINDMYYKVTYLFYRETDPKKAAEFMAEILGAKEPK